MIAAVYARKSTDQSAAYAHRKGWTVPEACVFVDDGISGAEFASRPGFVRLMAALKPRPPFQVLIMSGVGSCSQMRLTTAERSDACAGSKPAMFEGSGDSYVRRG